LKSGQRLAKQLFISATPFLIGACELDACMDVGAWSLVIF
jgi:hypothetical protein